MLDSNKTKDKRRVLISPLNWGLGHATRLIPIIKQLIKEGHYCVIAGESPSLDILKAEFPELQAETLNGFNIRLSNKSNQLSTLLSQIPAFIRSVQQEYRITQTLIKKHNIDLIISDNRYGVRSDGVASIIITHQTQPNIGKKIGFLKPISNYISRLWIRQFDECWIPDDANRSLSAKLSKPIKRINTKYIGILSRLDGIDNSNANHETNDILVILSGPEEVRKKLETQLFSKLHLSKYKCTFLLAKPDEELQTIDNITLLPHCSPHEFKMLLQQSSSIICRSGYSTIMDLVHCNKSAVLIPTPGQYEQEYLAQHMSQEWGFKTILQKEINTIDIDQLLVKNTINTWKTGRNFVLPQLPTK